MTTKPVAREFYRTRTSHLLSALWLRITIRLLPALVAWVACGWMVGMLAQDPALCDVAFRSKDWGALGLAVGLAAAGQLLFYSRWHWLLRVVSAPLTWIQAVASSAVAELLSYVAAGAVCGDVYRGLVTGRSMEGHRIGLVTAILADRVAGLYSIFCLAAIAGSLANRGTAAWNALIDASMPLLWLAVAGGGICIVVGLFVNFGPLLAFTRRWPLVYRAVVPVLAAIERFRSRPWAYGVAVLWGVGVHAINATVLWLIAKGLSLPHPSWAEHCVIASLATCIGLLPLPMSGLGAVELVIERLYRAAVPEAGAAGLVASLGYRLLSLIVMAGCALVLPAVARRWSPEGRHAAMDSG